MIAKIRNLTAFLGVTCVALVSFTAPAIAVQAPNKVWSEADQKMFGYLLEPSSNGKYTTFLGRHPGSADSENLPIWCVNVTYPDPSDGDNITLDTVKTPTRTAPEGLQVSTSQIVYLIKKYQYSDDPVAVAAVSYLVHLNFEQESKRKTARDKYPNTNSAENLSHLREAVLTYADFIEAKAREFVAEAASNTQSGFQTGDAIGNGERSGKVYSLGVTNTAGDYLAGHDITVTLNGPAVFSETGMQTWSGKTAAEPISLDWKATGNGKVSAVSKISTARNTLTLLRTDGDKQNTVTIGARPKIDLTEITIPGPNWEAVFDFQPAGVSHVAKFAEKGAFTDSFKASADPEYNNGKWLSLSEKDAAKFGLKAGNVPVKYRATAYFAGSLPPEQSTDIPVTAQKLESVEVQANGPVEISASFQTPKPGFITVVWEVIKKDQGQLAELIHDDWSDDFGLPEETVSAQHEIQVDTALSVRTTKSGIYLTDDIFVSGFPHDHGSFQGDSRFKPDLAHLRQDLYFFRDGLEISDANLAQAEHIGTAVNFPAKNGFHPNISNNDFLVKQNADGTLIPGTYVFVTSFAGDDRVKAFTTSVSDKNEQYTVSDTPDLHTTLSFHGKKTVPALGLQTLTDRVCYTNLQIGKEYQLRGKLMNLADGKPLLDAQGKQITASKTFIPTGENDCENIEFEVVASDFSGKSAVAFESLFADEKEIAVHADLQDKNQTVEFVSAPKPAPKTAPKVKETNQKLAATGFGNIAFPIFFGLLALISGIALILIRRKRDE